jgi:hypothetical protein
VLTREPCLGDAHALELRAVVGQAEKLAEGVYAVRGDCRSVERLLSLRFEMLPLAVAASPTELIDVVGSLRFDDECWLDALTWELAHERRGALTKEKHVDSPELCARLSSACGRRMRVPSGSCPPNTLRFVCVETPLLCIFGIVTYAPSSAAPADATWAKRPHGYCAALPLSLARVAINVASAGTAYPSIVDPCCA